MVLRFASILILMTSLVAQVSWASEASRLSYDPKTSLPWSIGAFLFWGNMEIFEDDLAPSNCRWCGSNSFDDSIRDSLRWKNASRANKASHISSYVASSLWAGLGLWYFGEKSNLRDDLGIVFEAVSVAGALSKAVQFSVGRGRPGISENSKKGSDNTSFYSGHTNTAFALAVSAGTVACLRGYKGSAWIWAVGLSLASLSGYLRIAADRHYASDVLMGASMGALAGFTMPYFFHRSQDPSKEADSWSFQILPISSGALALASRSW